MAVPVREGWIADTVTEGMSFADVGGLWGTVNEQVTVAARAGVTDLTMVDLAPQEGETLELWRLFEERCKAAGVVNVRNLSADVHDPCFSRSVGRIDVVHCSGVLYHSPQPLKVLQHLRQICERWLILGSATVPECVTTSAGSVRVTRGGALFVPAIGTTAKLVLGEWLSEVGGTQAIGVNSPLAATWDLTDYAAWWWFFSPEFIVSLLTLSGFSVQGFHSYWEGRATLFLAAPST